MPTTAASDPDASQSSASAALVSVSIESEDALRELYMPFIEGGGLFIPASEELPDMGQSMVLMIELPAIKLREVLLTEVVWLCEHHNGTAGENDRRGFGLRLRDHRNRLQTILESELSGRLSDTAPTLTL